MAELDPDVKIREVEWVRRNLLWFVGSLAVEITKLLLQKGLIVVSDIPLTLRTQYTEMKRILDKYSAGDF
jgi:hypothetical protein